MDELEQEQSAELPNSEVPDIAEENPGNTELPENFDAEAESEGQSDEEVEEVEYEGKKYRVPAELKDALLRQSDYTRKTQEAAEIRKAAEEMRQQLEAEREVQAASLNELSRIGAIDMQLEQFSRVNWAMFYDDNPAQAAKMDRQMRDLQAQRAQLANVVAQRQAHLSQLQQEKTARQKEEGLRVLRREIPDWGPDIAQKLYEFGKSRGYSESTLKNTNDPQFVLDLHEKYKVSQRVKQAAQPQKPRQEKPVTTISASKGKAQIDPDKLSPEQWLKWRNAQVRKPR